MLSKVDLKRNKNAPIDLSESLPIYFLYTHLPIKDVFLRLSGVFEEDGVRVSVLGGEGDNLAKALAKGEWDKSSNKDHCYRHKQARSKGAHLQQ